MTLSFAGYSTLMDLPAGKDSSRVITFTQGLAGQNQVVDKESAPATKEKG